MPIFETANQIDLSERIIMDMQVTRKSLSYLINLIDYKKPMKAQTPYYPQKTRIFRGNGGAYALPTATPESCGIRSGHIADYIDELNGAFSETRLNSLIVMRYGKIIAQRDYFPYDRSVPHVCYSLTKTFVGIAIGFLVEEGKLGLDTALVDILDDSLPPMMNGKFKEITVRHLLTMTSGVVFSEIGAVTVDNWVKGFLTSNVKTKPGKTFSYNSMNTYALSVCVKKITDENVGDYLHSRLFEPLGISEYFFEKSPNGIDKGGWGLYLSPLDIAKVAQCIADRGMYNGQRVIPEAWVDAMLSKQIASKDNASGYDYSFQIWYKEKPAVSVMNGLFGQNALIFRDTGVVVVYTASQQDMFQDNVSFAVTEKYFGDASAFSSEEIAPENDGVKRLERVLCFEPSLVATRCNVDPNTSDVDDATDFISRIDGKKYDFNCVGVESVSILPIVLQISQNNFAQGIKSIKLTKVSDCAVNAVFYEKNKEISVRFGLCGRAERSEIEFNGEHFLLASTAYVTYNDDCERTLTLRVSYVEMGIDRRLKLSLLSNGRIKVTWEEFPATQFFNGFADDLDARLESLGVSGILLSFINKENVRFKLKTLASPTLIGAVANKAVKVLDKEKNK